MGKLATFRTLSPADRRAACEAIGELLLAMAAVRFIPPKFWPRRFPPVVPMVAGYPASPAEVRRVRCAIARAEANLRALKPKCLPLALAGQRMLRRRGIPADFYLGTARPGTAGDRFHAWLKVGDAWITGDCDESDYTLLAAPLHTNA